MIKERRTKELMYKKLAKYYDLIYSKKNYKKEASELKKIINRHKKSKGKKLLEVACGTGNYLQFLKKDFNCFGIDINEGILKVARKKLKGMPLKKADMINFNLNRQFDVILCLFSSIGYAKTYDNLRKTIFNFAKHLKQGGVVVINSWFTKKQIRAGELGLAVYNGKDLKVVRLNSEIKVKGNLSIFDFHFLIAEKGKEVKHFVDVHSLGLFETSPFLKIMKEAGFKAKLFEKSKFKRGYFIGVKE